MQTMNIDPMNQIINSDTNKLQVHMKFLYTQYTQHIANIESHINKRSEGWTISMPDRSAVMSILNELIRNLIKVFNLVASRSFVSQPSNQVVHNVSLTTHKSFYDAYILGEIRSTREIPKDDFHPIKRELLKLIESYGIGNLDQYFSLYIGECYRELISPDLIQQIDIFINIFTIISVYTADVSNKEEFIVTSCNSTYDALIDTSCVIKIVIPELKTLFVFEGFLMVDPLNIIYRSSQICARQVYLKRQNVLKIIADNYPDISEDFLKIHSEADRSVKYFLNSDYQIAKMIYEDYEFLHDMKQISHTDLTSMFKTENMSGKFRIINLLLMGSEKQIKTATVLYDYLKEVRQTCPNCKDIIFRNLTYYQQKKLVRYKYDIKSELEKLRNMKTDSLSIEKQVALQADMPDQAKNYILERLPELKNGESSAKVSTAINGILKFPWKPINYVSKYHEIGKTVAASRKYMDSVSTKMSENIYGLEEPKNLMCGQIAKWIHNPSSPGQVIGLVGPPGVGKTQFAHSIADAVGLPLIVIGLAGMSDSCELVGHSYTYANAQYGSIIRNMIQTGVWNAIVLFDEVDKVSRKSETIDIHNVLMHLTDPSFNRKFQDRFYSSAIDFDLSGLTIILSYNDASKLDSILRDRITEIKIPAYSTKDKVQIMKKHVLPTICKDYGFKPTDIQIADDVIEYIAMNYTMESGVRNLKRKLDKIIYKLNLDRIYLTGPFQSILESYGSNKLAKKHTFDMKTSVIIDIALVVKYLEKPKMSFCKINEFSLVGVINGMYATDIGIGGIMPIQIFPYYEGSEAFSLHLTGSQHDVMKESVKCAMTCAINILANKYQSVLSTKFKGGFHVHAPEGAVPKDGPSAGAAFTTAFISAITGKKIQNNVAMTGEIELTGKVTKIGGLHAKILGAHRAGVRTVFLCQDNQDDYEQIEKKEPEICSDLNIIFVNHILQIVTDKIVIPDIEQADFN